MDTASTPDDVTLRQLAPLWLRIGLLSFGGPAAQIALMHDELVERRKLISDARFVHALQFCTFLPGPEAQQLATYIGWLLHGVPGGVVAGGLFVLPGAVVVGVLSALDLAFHQVPAIAALFFGLKAAVLALVVQAVWRVGKRALRTPALVVVAVLAFVALFATHVPFALVLGGAALVGVVLARLRPAWIPASVHDAKDQSTDSVVDHLLAHGRLPHTLPNTRRALTLALVCGALWLAPVVVTRLTGPPILADLGVYFSEMAVVTFGGAYAVLAGMADHAVTSGWLSTAQMLQGLGFAETTPGPLILVVEYVGMFAAWHASSSWWIALCGAALSVWVTFAPCFLWVFVGGPYVEALRHVRALYAALAGITAAVVGVIASLSVWFALHTVFVRVHEWTWGVLRVPVPELASIDLRVVALTSLSLLLLLRFNQSTPRTLAIVTVLGALLQWLT